MLEMMVVITVIIVMLGLCAGLIHLLLRLDRGSRGSADQARDIARLATDFRADAHAALPTISTEGSPETLTLTMADSQTVEYRVRPNDILRTRFDGDEVLHYDRYQRPVNASIRFESTREGSTTLATLVIDRPLDGKEDSLYRDFRIVAEVGRNRRLYGRAE
jgi:hypothetical protein